MSDERWADGPVGQCGWCEKRMAREDTQQAWKRMLGQWVTLLICADCVPDARRHGWDA